MIVMKVMAKMLLTLVMMRKIVMTLKMHKMMTVRKTKMRKRKRKEHHLIRQVLSQRNLLLLIMRSLKKVRSVQETASQRRYQLLLRMPRMLKSLVIRVASQAVRTMVVRR